MKIVSRVTTMGTSMFSWKRGYMDTKTEPEDINFIQEFLVYGIKVKEW